MLSKFVIEMINDPEIKDFGLCFERIKLDKSIMTIRRFTRDKKLEKIIKLTKGISTARIQEIKNRHITINKIHLIETSDHLKEAIKKIDALNTFIDATSKQSAPNKEFIECNNSTILFQFLKCTRACAEKSRFSFVTEQYRSDTQSDDRSIVSLQNKPLTAGTCLYLEIRQRKYNI
ncbi:hypothetical protein AGLY_003370 [Aphis glycines]|uniref:Uncharacterized protein n=1 Tax=Aphis glycines TaxID=307491 RepID=A0A6G0U1K9_APHGL|nr:hypothetical protein AGLY_003370 [Aphis glycines]